MTAQITEKLLYEGVELGMCSTPLDMFFRLAGISPEFRPPHSALRRGYVGTWEILSERLYLVGIKGELDVDIESKFRPEKVNLRTFFPKFPKRVFAHWFSGILRVSRGKTLHYEHLGFLSVTEEDLFITLEKGVVTNVEVVKNDPNVDYSPVW